MSAAVPEAVERAGAAAATRAADRLAAAVRAALPGVAVAQVADAVIVTGRGVLGEPLLRWPAGLIR